MRRLFCLSAGVCLCDVSDLPACPLNRGYRRQSGSDAHIVGCLLRTICNIGRIQRTYAPRAFAATSKVAVWAGTMLPPEPRGRHEAAKLTMPAPQDDGGKRCYCALFAAN